MGSKQLKPTYLKTLKRALKYVGLSCLEPKCGLFETEKREAFIREGVFNRTFTVCLCFKPFFHAFDLFCENLQTKAIYSCCFLLLHFLYTILKVNSTYTNVPTRLDQSSEMREKSENIASLLGSGTKMVHGYHEE